MEGIRLPFEANPGLLSRAVDEYERGGADRLLQRRAGQNTENRTCRHDHADGCRRYGTRPFAEIQTPPRRHHPAPIR